MIYCQYHKSLGLVFLRDQTSCSPAASCAHAYQDLQIEIGSRRSSLIKDCEITLESHSLPETCERGEGAEHLITVIKLPREHRGPLAL
jgi:hypothetical protein